MTDPKPIAVLWSRMAAVSAGLQLSGLQATILDEVSEITSEAKGWFFHAVPAGPEDQWYSCMGRETDAAWTVSVRLARSDHPDPEHRETRFSIPEKVADPENEVFIPFAELPR